MEETSKRVRHTPAPWRVKHFTVSNHRYSYKINADAEQETDEEAEANAHLIAAAPSLLEALEAVQRLKQLLEYPREVSEVHVGEAMAVSNMLRKVDEAIKLAKGEIKTELI